MNILFKKKTQVTGWFSDLYYKFQSTQYFWKYNLVFKQKMYIIREQTTAKVNLLCIMYYILFIIKKIKPFQALILCVSQTQRQTEVTWLKFVMTRNGGPCVAKTGIQPTHVSSVNKLANRREFFLMTNYRFLESLSHK